MAYEADRVVVELLAQNDQFDAATKSSAQNFQQSMAGIKASGAEAEGGVARFSSALKENRLGMNQSRIGMMEFQHVARGVSDQLGSSGVTTQLFTSHIGELSEAIVLSGGAFGKLGAFLQGPWGIALTLATTAAVALISAHKDQGDTLEGVYDKLVKHKEQTDLSAQADEMWSHSLGGLTERMGKLNDELEKRLTTQTEIERHTLSQAQFEASEAQNAVDQAGRNPGDTSAAAAADAALTRANRTLINAQILSGAQAGEAMSDASVAAKKYSDELDIIIRKIQTLHPELTEAALADPLRAAVDQVKQALSEGVAAGLDLNPQRDQVNRLMDDLAHGRVTVEGFDTAMISMAASVRATTEAFKNQDHAIADFKKSVIGAEGTGQNRLGSSAAGFGQFMPSTFEGYFKQLYPQQAAGMSNSQIDALRNNRQVAEAVIDAATKDYVTVIKAAGQQITTASLYTVHLLGSGDARKLFAASSDTPTSSFLSSAVLRGNPFLQGTAGTARAAIAKRIGDSSGPVSAGAAALAQAQIDAAKLALQQQAAFTSENDRLNEELLKARSSQVKDALAVLDFSEAEVRAEQEKRDDGYRSSVTTKKLTQAEADQLIALSASVAAEKIKALEVQRQAEIIRREDQAAERSAQYREDDLRDAEQAATSQAQRRELDLAILDVLYNEKLLHLERLKLIAEGNHDIAAANDIQAQIDRLPAEKSADRAGVIRQTFDPLQAWMHSVPNDAHAVTEALQGIAVNGFDQLASSIAGVLTGTESLGQAFGNLAKQVIGDLVQMTIKMLIFRALSSLIGGGGIPAPDLGALSQVDIGATGSLFSAPDLSSVVANLPHLAGGGSGIIGGRGGSDNNLLSINGDGVAWVSQGEGLTISPTGARAASPFGSSNGIVVVQVEASPYFDGRVIEVAGPVIAQASTRAAQGGSALARSDLSRTALHTLR